MTRYHHVDVFADAAYTGNSLAVFLDPPPLRAGQMLAITRELRHFETIFGHAATLPATYELSGSDRQEITDTWAR